MAREAPNRERTHGGATGASGSPRVPANAAPRRPRSATNGTRRLRTRRALTSCRTDYSAGRVAVWIDLFSSKRKTDHGINQHQAVFLPNTLKFFRPFSCPASMRTPCWIRAARTSRRSRPLSTTALAGMQSLGQKQTEILTATMTGLQSLAAQATRPRQAQAGRRERSGSAGAAQTLSDVRELSRRLIARSPTATRSISKRVAENVEELKALLQPAK